MCRSWRELSNEYLLSTIGVDTAENEPLEVWGGNSIQYSLLLNRAAVEAGVLRAAGLQTLGGRARSEGNGLGDVRVRRAA